MKTTITVLAVGVLVGLNLVAFPVAAAEECAEYHFVYDDDHEDQGVFCDGNDIKSGIHVTKLHVSCSDKFEGGEGQKSELDGHLVVAWKIVRTKDGNVDKECGPGVPERNVCPDLNPEAAELADGSILITFTPVADGLNIYRSEDGSPFGRVAMLGPDVNRYKDTDTMPDVTYQYVPVPVRGGQELERCPTLQVTTTPEQRDVCDDVNLQAVELTDGSILLTFDPVLDGINLYRSETGGGRSLIAVLGPQDTRYVDTDTRPGVTYLYVAAPVDGGMEVERCPPVDVTTTPEDRDVCEDLDFRARVSSDGSVQLRFNAVEDGLNIYRSEDGGAPTRIAQLGGSATSFHDTDTEPGTTYRYVPVPVRDGQQLERCPPVTVTTPTDGGDVCEDLDFRAKVLSDGTVALSFNAAADGLKIYRSEDGGTFRLIADLGSSATSFHDKETEPGTTYKYVPVPEENGKAIKRCPPVTVTTPPDGGDVCEDLDLQAQALGDGSIRLRFNPVGDGIHLFRSEGGGQLSLIARLGDDATSFHDTDTQPGTMYRYVAVPQENGSAIERCPPVTVTTPPDGGDVCEDLDLQAEALDDGSIRLRFNPVLDGVNIYRAEVDGSFTLVAVLDNTNDTFLDDSTEPGTTYRYVVAPVLDGEQLQRCPPIEVTAIPFFGATLAVVLASVAGVAAYAGFRRRRS